MLLQTRNDAGEDLGNRSQACDVHRLGWAGAFAAAVTLATLAVATVATLAVASFFFISGMTKKAAQSCRRKAV
jgi:hypothetical protein